MRAGWHPALPRRLGLGLAVGGLSRLRQRGRAPRPGAGRRRWRTEDLVNVAQRLDLGLEPVDFTLAVVDSLCVARQVYPLSAGGTEHERQRPRRRRRMASTRPPRMYSPSARVGKRRGGSTGVAGMVEFAGSDGRSTDPVNRSAASIRRRNRPNTAFKLRGRSDMRIHPSITEPRRPDGPFFKAAVRRTILRGKLLESLGLQRQTNRHLIDERPIKPASGLESCRGRTRRRSAGPPLLGGTAVRQRGPALVQARREDLRGDCVGVNRGRWQERAEVRRHERRGRPPAAAGRRLPVARENPDRPFPGRFSAHSRTEPGAATAVDAPNGALPCS